MISSLQLWLLVAILASFTSAIAQTNPVLAWITNSSVKVEQVVADQDWAALAQGSNLLTASQTLTRFNIQATDLGSSFMCGTNLVFLFGDTRGTNIDYNGGLRYPHLQRVESTPDLLDVILAPVK